MARARTVTALLLALAGLSLALASCDDVGGLDAGPPPRDASGLDAGPRRDASVRDASISDGSTPPADAAALPDAATPPPDAGRLDGAVVSLDAGRLDAGRLDAGRPDAGRLDAGRLDAGRPDAGRPDAGRLDAGRPDAGAPGGGCVATGVTGTHVARFRWTGSTSGGRASVSYEANTLPDTSRWRVGAYSRSIGYTPVFRDPFLAEGGLDMSGTVFIDVELSTRFLSTVRRATLSIYGRSFNTTGSGSFSWMSFSGSGATPFGFVSNVAPYRWYSADATSALPAGDGGTLLRIEPGPPSNALIVARGEICFDAS